MDEQRDGWMDRKMDGWIERWMDREMDGWVEMDGYLDDGQVILPYCKNLLHFKGIQINEIF